MHLKRDIPRKVKTPKTRHMMRAPRNHSWRPTNTSAIDVQECGQLSISAQ